MKCFANHEVIVTPFIQGIPGLFSILQNSELQIQKKMHFATIVVLINIAVESFFGFWLFISPGTVPEFPGALPTSEGALTSRRMYASAILSISAAAICGHVAGQRTNALVAFSVLHTCLVATFLLAQPAGLAERLGTAVHLTLGAISLIAARLSITGSTASKSK